MDKFMIDHNETINELKDLIKKYESIFVVDELEKWSLQNMETSVFQKDIYLAIDAIDSEIKKDLIGSGANSYK